MFRTEVVLHVYVLLGYTSTAGRIESTVDVEGRLCNLYETLECKDTIKMLKSFFPLIALCKCHNRPSEVEDLVIVVEDHSSSEAVGDDVTSKGGSYPILRATAYHCEVRSFHLYFCVLTGSLGVRRCIPKVCHETYDAVVKVFSSKELTKLRSKASDLVVSHLFTSVSEGYLRSFGC